MEGPNGINEVSAEEMRGEDNYCHKCGQIHNAGFLGMLVGAFSVFGIVALLLLCSAYIRGLFFG